ncbi:MAG: DUF3883 domain-containing protein [Chitinophagaceae bacterium]|nr:MAG: DUF3883 domain-containing protein [Chitinophagaceae bacterium]
MIWWKMPFNVSQVMTHQQELTPESLKFIVKEIFDEYKVSSDDGLQSLLNVQRHFTKSYKTRHFLELLQNSRDAIVESGAKDGKIRAWIDGDDFYFANNGKDFDRKGVRSICYTAISEKDSIRFVGHKGIGFNSVLELTDSPSIITKAGTFFFNSQDALLELGRDTSIDLPLFQFPIFRPETIYDLDPQLEIDGFRTVFKFPLKESFTDRISLTSSHRILPEDLLFLGAIKNLQIGEQYIRVHDELPIRVEVQGIDDVYFRSYETTVSFSDETFEEFDKDEQEMFKEIRDIECRFLLKVGKDGHFVRNNFAKIHLFYATDAGSGFSFSIHGLFSVVLDRKRLADRSKVNLTLFNAIASYYCGNFLDTVKRDFPNQVLEILSYKKQENNGLDELYRAIGKLWSSTEFIYHAPSQRYLKPSEVFLVDENDYSVFRDGFLGPMALLHVADKSVQDWLNSECKVPRIYNSFIEEHVEGKCRQYQHDTSFFQQLYELVERKQLQLQRREVLLSQNRQLVCGSVSQVYYQRTSSFTSPAALSGELSFIHEDIKIGRLKDDALKWLGLTEYSRQNLIDLAVRVLKKSDHEMPYGQQIIKDILKFLLQFDDLEEANLAKIKNNLYLPVEDKSTGVKRWASPLYESIYFPDFPFAHLYGNNLLNIDFEILGVSEDSQWHEFLKKLGVWDLPGLFIVKDKNAEALTLKITGDRKLHIPEKVSEDFYFALLNNWNLYRDFICTSIYTDRLIIDGKYYSSDSEKVNASTVFSQLSEIPWFVGRSKDGLSYYRPSEIIVLDQVELKKTVNQVWFEFFPVSEFDAVFYSEFCSDFNIKHFRYSHVQGYCRILEFFKSSFPDLDQIVSLGNFEKCFHRFLGYLSTYLSGANYPSNINPLKEYFFLSKSIIDGSYSWTVGKDCLLIDRKDIVDKLKSKSLLEEFRYPYAFTKKDRNEWGRFAKDIGRPISSLVRTEIRNAGTTANLLEKFRNFETIIAFVEYDLDRAFSPEEILQFKDAEVMVHNSLEIQYFVNQNETTLGLDHYVHGEKQAVLLHLDQKCIGHIRKLSLALLDYFEQYTGRELKRFEYIFEVILKFGSANDLKKEYAAEKNIDVQRIEEIGQLLFENYLVDGEENVGVSELLTIGTNIIVPTSKHTSITTTQEIEVVEIETGISDQQMLDRLEALVSLPMVLFVDEHVDNLNVHPVGSATDVAQGIREGVLQDRFPAIFRREVSDRSKSEIGFYAEFYIFNKLLKKDLSLIDKLGITAETCGTIEWLNFHRVENRDLPDGSVGRGHDFYSSQLELAIEVKGMYRKSPFFTITGPEFTSMKLLRENYFLIIVTGLYQDNELIPLVVRDPYGAILSGTLKFAEAKMYSP